MRRAYNSTANALRGGFTNVHNGWDALTDTCTLVTSFLPGDNARKHAQELESNAMAEIKLGHHQLADKTLTRDLRFSISAFGLTDKLTVELSNELRALHKQDKDLRRMPILNEL